MVQRRKPAVSRESAAEQKMRDQEVVRANKELAAYFKGPRTEREARAALKIIKAFVRDRERLDATSRRPLPGAASSCWEPLNVHRARGVRLRLSTARETSIGSRRWPGERKDQYRRNF